jgi:hypothetical protein
MAASSPNRFAGWRLGTKAKKPENPILWPGASPSPPPHNGSGCCVALSMRFDPRRTPWSVACDGGVISVPKRRGFVFGPAVGVAA